MTATINLANPCVVQLPVDIVHGDPDQHRKHFDLDALRELGESIKQQGQLTPIYVSRLDNGEVGYPMCYQVIAGERRLRACIMAGIGTVNAIVVDRSDLWKATVQATENIARKDVRPCEEARAYQRIIHEYQLQHPGYQNKGLDCTNDAMNYAAKNAGVSWQRITTKLNLLELPADVQQMVDAGSIAEGIGLELSRLMTAPEYAVEEEAREMVVRRMARAAAASGETATSIRIRVTTYLGQMAQGTMFDDEEAAKQRRNDTKGRLDKACDALAKVVNLTFSERHQRLSLGSLTGNELAVVLDKLQGSEKYLALLIASVKEAMGRE